MTVFVQYREIEKCKRGHLRISSNQYKDGRCRPCALITNKNWYQNNKPRHKELMQAWYAENHDRQLELQRGWYLRNREEHLERSRLWAANNLPLKTHYRRIRRAKIANAAGVATPEQVMLRMEYFGFKCSYCSGPFEEVDHALPLDRGGSNWPANLRPACKRCNRKKATKTVFEFLELMAR